MYDTLEIVSEFILVLMGSMVISIPISLVIIAYIVMNMFKIPKMKDPIEMATDIYNKHSRQLVILIKVTYSVVTLGLIYIYYYRL